MSRAKSRKSRIIVDDRTAQSTAEQRLANNPVVAAERARGAALREELRTLGPAAHRSPKAALPDRTMVEQLAELIQFGHMLADAGELEALVTEARERFARTDIDLDPTVERAVLRKLRLMPHLIGVFGGSGPWLPDPPDPKGGQVTN